MKNFLFMLLILLMAFVLFGCVKMNHEPALKTVSEGESLLYQVDTAKIIQNGQRFYIPLGVSGNPDAHVNEIHGVLNDFEKNQRKANPPMKIVFWRIQERQGIKNGNNDTDNDFIYGLWVDCELITESSSKN